jgi:CBS domain-containing protein
MMKAAEIMTTEVVTIKGSATVAEAVTTMRDRNIRTLIVARRHDQDAYGIVTQTDVVSKVVAYGKDPKTVRVYEIMTKPCVPINPDLGVEYAARLMTSLGIHVAPVIKDKLLGIISFTDIINKSDFLEKPKVNVLREEIQAAIANARKLAQEKGASSSEAAVAWDIVEELQAEAAHQTAKPIQKTAFEEYCEENPNALEARMYDS